MPEPPLPPLNEEKKPVTIEKYILSCGLCILVAVLLVSLSWGSRIQSADFPELQL